MNVAKLFLEKLDVFFNDEEAGQDEDLYWGFMDDERNSDDVGLHHYLA